MMLFFMISTNSLSKQPVQSLQTKLMRRGMQYDVYIRQQSYIKLSCVLTKKNDRPEYIVQPYIYIYIFIYIYIYIYIRQIL